VPGAGVEPAWKHVPRDFEGEKGGWRKCSESLRNLRQTLNFIEEVDND
jgi:hypothetical protein